MEMESKNIPEDIIINILRRLPPKPLARFKCVCKSWESFANQHKYHNNKLLLFSRTTIQSIDFEAADEIKAVDLEIPFKVSNRNRMLGIASCNGLLCILYENEGFVIWNPLTGRYKRACLALNNPSDYNGFGFWYDHSTNNYKIVRLMRFADLNERPVNGRFSVDIYSQNTNSWQHKEILPWQIYLILGNPHSYFGVLVNEALYWKIRYFNNDKDNRAVLRFDTLNEKFDVILSPENVDIHDIGVFKGHVCLVEYQNVDSIDIWTREVGNNQNWVKFMNLPPFERKSRFDELAPICSMKNDEILASVREMDNFLESWTKKEFLLYSPDVKTYKKVHISGTVKHFTDEITYTDTFVSP